MPNAKPEARQEADDTKTHTKTRTVTHPHLSALYFPLVPFPLISPPFRLQKVKDVREVEVLAIERWRRCLSLLLSLLLGLLLLLLLLLLLTLVLPEMLLVLRLHPRHVVRQH